ncbi:uncharacterized protein LOC122398508 isoform X2 [Colletes gigas]|uniref:uncharacterized protein LOC122398508 isoform X2 n=1 Tax=Colletes gigas TaxID=935657 RepID=UPI001C9AC018|nr:uncharacterized protein LOC122398508 isoform X2 [Colletes gigas]
MERAFETIGRKMSVEVRAGRPTMPTIPQSKRPTILVYPTVTPESIIIPIVSCILGFPLLALMVICCLRRRAKLARERARRRNCDLDHGALSLVRFSPVHRLASKEDLAGIDRSTRAVSLRSDRGSRAFPSLDLDTVVEERSDPEQSTALELSSPD